MDTPLTTTSVPRTRRAARQRAAGIADLSGAWKRRQLALYFAWTETLARYRRSLLGPFWLVLSTIIGVVGLGFVWSTLLKVDAQEFIPSLTIGLVAWQFVSGSVIEAAGVFSRSAGSILNIRLPTFLISLQLLCRQAINLAHNAIVVVAILIIYPEHLSWVSLLALPGLLIVAVSIFATIQLLGYLGARYRDLEPLVAAFMPILFFLSPVIYQSRQLGEMQLVMEFNPLAQWITMVRDPALGIIPSWDSYATVIVMAAFLWAAAIWVTGSRSHRLAYWI